uniref:Uncharacterized protein n=1 Tax=Oryza nivara TaxID=4536 RepID=A0A0E0HY86_ORYNI
MQSTEEKPTAHFEQSPTTSPAHYHHTNSSTPSIPSPHRIGRLRSIPPRACPTIKGSTTSHARRSGGGRGGARVLLLPQVRRH